jgi:hypothetical protein
MATPSFLSDSQGERVDSIIDSAGSTYYKGAIGSNAAGGNGPTAGQLIGTHKPSVATAATDPFVAIMGTVWGAIGSNTAPVAVDASGRTIVVGIAGGTPVPISGTITSTPPANASTNLTQVGGAAIAEGQALSAASLPVVLATDGVTIGATNEAVPATDTTASGLNGGLKRIAARLTSLIALLPAALGGGGGLKVEGLGGSGTPAGGVMTVQGASGIGLTIGTLATVFADNVIPPNILIDYANAPSIPTVALAVHDGTGLAVAQRTPAVFKPFSAVLITAETTIWTPAAGKKFRLMGYAITQGVVTGAITIKGNTAGATILVIPQHTIGVVQISPAIGNGILSAAANNVLTATGVATETITGYVFGTEE